jgi:stage II sporulation protein D
VPSSEFEANDKKIYFTRYSVLGTRNFLCYNTRPMLTQTLRFFFVLVFSFAPLLMAGELKKTALELPPHAEDLEFVKISLATNISQMTVSIDAPYTVTDADGAVVVKGNALAKTIIKGNTLGILFGAKTISSSPIILKTKIGGIRFDKHTYRHALIIWKEKSGKISVVNEIPLEDYLKGVLPWEANPKWTMESLKAQAVAARTYAVFKGIENQKQRFAMSKDVLSQVYGGKNIEHPVTDRAVESTRGQILVHDGKVFPAYFHSTCGGATTHAEYIWEVEPHPSLKGVKCTFCHPSKHYKWSQEFSIAKIESVLKKKGIRASGITDIQATDLDETGRAKTFQITDANEKFKVHSNEFRIWMDPAKFKSTWIVSINKSADKFIFKGRGWGHGVGLCQYGMKGLGELGYEYRDIIRYYYPGADIIEIDEKLKAAIAASPKAWWKKAKEFFAG